MRKAVPANEDKVYIAFMTTDGDATWFVYNLISTDWANPLHGKMKYNWGFLPLTCDLMPGMFRYYCDHETPDDFFVAGPSGAAYTYPHMHPDPSRFLDLTARYMERCGLNTVHMTNWDDRTGWQEVEDSGFVPLLRKHLPDCAGYVRGMGESAFEKNYIQGGNPYIFCGEGIHSTSDVYATLKEFIDACANRPLFLFVLINHTVSMDRIRDAVNRFPENTLELVHLDELFLRIEKAYEERTITEDLYPYKSGLTAILSKEARSAWPGFRKEMDTFKAAFSAGEKSYLEYVRSCPAGLEKVHTGEFLAFESVWHSMKLVKLTLEMKGIYVNEKKEASRQFIRHFGSMAEASVVPYLHRLWDRWHDETIRFDEASILAERLCNLTEEMNVRLFAGNS